MPELTRRRDPEAQQETWLIHYGDVRVGVPSGIGRDLHQGISAHATVRGPDQQATRLLLPLGHQG